MLRNYQKEICLRIFDAWKEHRSLMVQMPTGTGKTHLLAAVVKVLLREKEAKSIWIVAHRRELVCQIKETVMRYGMQTTNGPISVMSIQWLSRNRDNVEGNPALIVIDEAHHALATTYTEVINSYPQAKVLGLTATPCRMNCRGFTHLFDTLIASESIAEFMKKGYLSLFDYISIRTDSREQLLIDSLKKRGTDGDFQIREMDEVLNRKPSIERLYRSVDRFARGKKGIVYAISIGHAQQVAAYYNQMGIPTAAIDSHTPSAERREKVEAFKQGKLQVLVNVDVFSEGFDCPDVAFVQLARPTLSLAKYLQQVGRGLRATPGKAACTIIDNVGLYRIFGLPTQVWDWQQMFEGRVAGKGKPISTIAASVYNTLAWEIETVKTEAELEKVVSHDRLLDVIAQEKETNCKRRVQHAEKAERESRIAYYRRKGKVRLLNGDLLAVTYTGHKTRYIDLQNGQPYTEKPVIKKYGNMELLKTGRVYHSRTLIPYTNTYQPADYEIRWQGYYLTIMDQQVPPTCRGYWSQEQQNTTGEVCLLEGDRTQVYWLYRRMCDGSIVVRDKDGRYFHAAKGGSKVCIGSEHPTDGEHHYLEAIAQLVLRTEVQAQQRLTEQENKKRLALKNYLKAIPVRVGSKWGLQLGERVLVPPLYRKVLPPIGKYCAVEGNPLQWGIIAVDGMVVVAPQYPKVEIGNDGIAILTLVTGKTIPVKLDTEYDRKLKTVVV